MFHLVMGLVGAMVALVIGVFFMSALTDGLCEGITNDDFQASCESTKNTAWLVIGILPIALFFALFTMFGGTGFARQTISVENIEQRVKKMQRLGINHILKKTHAILIDESKRGNKLYAMKDKLVPNYTLKYLVYDDPSSPEKTYGCFVPSSTLKADQAMAWKFQITEEEYGDLEVEA